MEIKLKGNEIILIRELSALDKFVLDFTDILTKHSIKHIIVSAYVAALFGRDRMCRTMEFLTQRVSFEKFLKLWLELESTYECLSTGDVIDAYNGYLRNHHAIRIAEKDNLIPDIEIRFVKNEIDRFSLKYRKQLKLKDKTLFIPPLETQIPYMLSLGSGENIEDARFLFKLFEDELNIALLDRFLAELNIPQESFDRYLAGADIENLS